LLIPSDDGVLRLTVGKLGFSSRDGLVVHNLLRDQ